jgi:3-phosphoshikimate 1-carboxyvinyltransferase
LSALAGESGVIRGGLAARDTSLMIAALGALGASIDDSDPAMWVVAPLGSVATGSDPSPNPTRIDCGLAGTVMRFVPPVAALGTQSVSFFGDEAASARPQRPLLEGLRQLGVRVESDSLPFLVTGPLSGHEAVIDSSGSSQFVSGLILSAPRFPQGLRLTHQGPPIPSLPHIEMTVAALADRGVRVRHEGCTWEVAPSPIAALDETIEPDLTTAAVFFAAALVTGGSLTVSGWPAYSTQPGARVPEILSLIGGSFMWSEAGLTVVGDGVLHGIDVDLHDVSELTPVVAALATLADSPSRIRSVAHIRGHETDRLAALASEITALGGDCREHDDGLAVYPRPLHAGVFHTYADHRLAHAGALLGLVTEGISLDDVACTAKTMPTFPDVWEGLIE